MKFILIGSYVGEGVSGSHRQERFINKALEEGFPVLLIKPAGSWKGLYEFILPQDFNHWKLNYTLSNAKGSVSNNKLKAYILPLKYILFFDVLGYGFFNTIRLLKVAMNKKLNSKYFLLVSSPSISLAVGTYLFSIFSKEKLTYSVDMRDAWAFHPSIKIFRSIRKWIEGKILKRAEFVITVSKYLKDEFDVSYKINTKVLYNVNTKLLDDTNRETNNKIVVENKSPVFDNKYLNICYFGSLPDTFYNLHEFCKGLTNYVNNASRVKNPVRFHFYGPCRELENLISVYPVLQNILMFNPSVPHSKAIHLMRSCDAVLFFGFNGDKNSGVVSTKIFEYFYLRLKIIAFDIRIDSDLDWLFKKTCDQSVLINNSEEFSQYLNEVLINVDLLPSCKNQNVLSHLDLEYNIFLKNLKSK